MTTSVDVLAVMLETSDDLRAEGYIGWVLPLEEARAAVAELIEAATFVEIADRDAWLDDEIVQRMRIALARVKGA